jgi:hypothetical protein
MRYVHAVNGTGRKGISALDSAIALVAAGLSKADQDGPEESGEVLTPAAQAYKMRTNRGVFSDGILMEYRFFLERAAGIEPATLAWKARALPLCNARVSHRLGWRLPGSLFGHALPEQREARSCQPVGDRMQPHARE